MTAENIQRWALHGSQFCYEIEFKRGHANNADFFSIVLIDSVPTTETEHYEVGYVFSISEEVLPNNVETVTECTAKDSVLLNVMKFLDLDGRTSHQSRATAISC